MVRPLSSAMHFLAMFPFLFLIGCRAPGGEAAPSSGSPVTTASPSPTPSATPSAVPSATPSATPSPTPSSVPSPLSVDASSASLVPNASKTFSVSGGTAPYAWTISAGTGTLTAATGASTSYSSPTSQNAEVTVTDAANASVHIPIRVSQTLTSISHGGWDACAVLSTGAVKCWGYDLDGRAGDGGTANTAVPVAVTGLGSGVSKISFGNVGCALMTTGKVNCFGTNYYGSMGNGVSGSLTYAAPTEVAGLSNVVEVGVGSYTVCARLVSGEVDCWGNNTFGQVGNGTTTLRTTPQAVAGVANAIQLTVGTRHVCAVLSDHTAKCWGQNNLGQLGDGTLTDRSNAVAVVGVSNITQIAVGGFHTCALISDGTVTCWGRGDSGQLGNGSFATNQATPTPIPGLTGVTFIAAGGDNTCALAGNTLWCWGDQQSGAVGSGAPAHGGLPFGTPQAVANIAGGVTAISIGPSAWGSTVLALVNGQAYTWGLNDNLQLGNGTSVPNQVTPQLTAPF